MSIVRMAWLATALSALMLAIACGGDDDGSDDNGGPASIDLSSEVFDEGGEIPADFTCDGRDHSPILRWGGRPGDAEALAIVMDDLDADFVHWVVYDLDPALGGLDFIGNQETVPPSGAPQGINDFGDHGYSGPCPPPGDEPHTYRFRLFVLDALTGLEPGATLDELDAAMEGHILRIGELTGTYAR